MLERVARRARLVSVAVRSSLLASGSAAGELASDVAAGGEPAARPLQRAARRPAAVARRLVDAAVVASVVGLWACADVELDEADESGAEPGKEGERYELVRIEAPEEAPAAAPRAGPGAPAPSRSPADSVAAAVTSGDSLGRRAEMPGQERAEQAGPASEAAGAPAPTPAPAGSQPVAAVNAADARDALGAAAAPGEPVVLDPRGDWVIQVGSFAERAGADKLVGELRAEGYPAYRAAAPGGGGYRVRIGFFRTRGDADRFGQIFQADRHLQYWVDRRHDAE